MGITVLRVLGTTVGRGVPGGNSLGQELEGTAKDGSGQEGLERPEGRQGGGGGVLALGGLD